jgi:hypothetical protein
MELYVALIGCLLLLLFIYCIIISARLRRLDKSYQAFMAGSDGQSLEGQLTNLYSELRGMSAEMAENRRHMAQLQQAFAGTVRGVGVVRFNAFQNTGGDLSFAVALLTGKQDGVVFSSIYGREESRFYVKPISAGSSAYQLSAEEWEAIQQAVGMMSD